MDFPVNEGFISFRGNKTWYRMVGDHEEPGRLPVICLHGGPGSNYACLQPFESLANRGRRVIFYNQIGSGMSGCPDDSSLWTIELFAEQVGAVCQGLKLECAHLLGFSWGGMLALQYALGRPKSLASLIIASGLASIPLWVQEIGHLIDQLPAEAQRVIHENEAAGTTDSPEYKEACRDFYHRHMGPYVEPLPEWFTKAFETPINSDILNKLYGPEEFVITGRMKDWDITDQLAEINVPTLLLSGRHDIVSPATLEPVRRSIPNCDWVIFEKSGHYAYIDEADRFFKVLDEFLSRVEMKGK